MVLVAQNHLKCEFFHFFFFSFVVVAPKGKRIWSEYQIKCTRWENETKIDGGVIRFTYTHTPIQFSVLNGITISKGMLIFWLNLTWFPKTLFWCILDFFFSQSMYFSRLWLRCEWDIIWLKFMFKKNTHRNTIFICTYFLPWKKNHR